MLPHMPSRGLELKFICPFCNSTLIGGYLHNLQKISILLFCFVWQNNEFLQEKLLHRAPTITERARKVRKMLYNVLLGTTFIVL